MQVKATKMGYYNHKRVREGAEFTIKSEKEFSKNWMEKLDEDEAPVPAKKGKGKAKAEVEPEAEAE